jgi:hypothetical protein
MFDTDHWLPEAARRRLDAIRERAVQERAVRMAVTDSQAGAATAKRAAQDELDRLKRYLGNKSTIAAQEKAAEALAAAQDALALVNGRLAKLPSSAAALEGRVTRFVKGLRGPVAAAKAVKFAPHRGEAPATAVERLRAERASLMADFREVKASPVTAAEARAIVTAQVDELAASGAPSTLSTIEAGIPFTWPRSINDGARRTISGEVPSTLPFICWLARDLLVERLCAEVDELADDSRALVASMRGYRENELLTQMLALERAEVAAIEHAEQSGVTIEYRSDCDLRAVLGLAVEVLGEV